MQLACLRYKNKQYIKTFKIHIVAKSSSCLFGKKYLFSNKNCNNKCQLIKGIIKPVQIRFLKNRQFGQQNASKRRFLSQRAPKASKIRVFEIS